MENVTFRHPSGDTMWPVCDIAAQKEDVNLKYKFRSDQYKDLILIHDHWKCHLGNIDDERRKDETGL